MNDTQLLGPLSNKILGGQNDVLLALAQRKATIEIENANVNKKKQQITSTIDSWRSKTAGIKHTLKNLPPTLNSEFHFLLYEQIQIERSLVGNYRTWSPWFPRFTCGIPTASTAIFSAFPLVVDLRLSTGNFLLVYREYYSYITYTHMHDCIYIVWYWLKNWGLCWRHGLRQDSTGLRCSASADVMKVETHNANVGNFFLGELHISVGKNSN